MQIAWFVSFSNFPSAADGHILLNAPDLFWPPKLSRREPAQYWPRGLVGKCLGCCRLLMHGGTQTIRFWGLQHVHWCEGSCCWFLRLQSRLVWDVPKALQGRQGMCGSLAGWFQVAIQAVDWFVPEHHLSIGLRCRFCEVHRRHLMHGGTQTIRFWGLQHVHWCEGSCCWFLRLQSRLVWDVPKALQGRQGMCGSLAGWFQVAIQAVDWFVPEHHLSIGLRCRFCEVHRRHLMHGGTQTIRFWGLQHVHWCEGSCCWFLRLQSRFPRLCKVDRGCAAAWQVGLRCSQGYNMSLQGWFFGCKQVGLGCSQGFASRQGMCGSLAGWFQVAIQAVDWCSRASSIYWFKVSFLRGSPSAFDAWWHANNPLLGATTCPLVWRLMLLVLAAAKQVGLRCSQGFARSTGDVRQPGRLVSGGYPGRRLVFPSIIYLLV